MEKKTSVAANGVDIITRERRGDTPHQHIDGICPCCGSEIEYEGSYDHDDDGATLRFRCPTCGVTGKAGYTFTFDQYYNLTGKDGKPIKD